MRRIVHLSPGIVLAVLIAAASVELGRLVPLLGAGTGICGGSAINDTSSVVAAGYAYSTAAGNDCSVRASG